MTSRTVPTDIQGFCEHCCNYMPIHKPFSKNRCKECGNFVDDKLVINTTEIEENEDTDWDWV